MDAKTILNPKGWLIGVGTINILFSIMNYIMGGDVATTALEAVMLSRGLLILSCVTSTDP